MNETGAYTTVEHDGFTVETNSGDAAAVRTSMGVEETLDDAGDRVPVAEGDGADPAVGGENVSKRAKPAEASVEPEEQPEGKPKGRTPARLIWEAKEAERKAKAAEDRAAAAEKRAQELEAAHRAASQPDRQPEAARDAKAPSASKFTFPKFEEWTQKFPDASYEDYVEEKTYSRIQHEAEQKDRERAERDQWDEHNKLVLAHRTREIQARAQYPDYDALVKAGTEAMAAAGFTHLPPALGKAILSSERSHDIVRDLAAHPADAILLAREVSDLPVAAAPMVRRLLESRLAAAPSGPAGSAKPVTSAKPLIKPVSGTPDATEPDDAAGSDDEPFEKHFDRENRRDKKTGRFR